MATIRQSLQAARMCSRRGDGRERAFMLPSVPRCVCVLLTAPSGWAIPPAGVRASRVCSTGRLPRKFVASPWCWARWGVSSP